MSANIEEIRDGGMRAIVTVVTEWGEAWVVAGVPTRHQQSAQAVARWDVYATVEPYGDSLEMWCPEGADPEAVLEAAWGPAMAAWRALDEDLDEE